MDQTGPTVSRMMGDPQNCTIGSICLVYTFLIWSSIDMKICGDISWCMWVISTKFHDFWCPLEWSNIGLKMHITSLLDLNSLALNCFKLPKIAWTSRRIFVATLFWRWEALLGRVWLGFDQKSTLIKLRPKMGWFWGLFGNLAIFVCEHA